MEYLEVFECRDWISGAVGDINCRGRVDHTGSTEYWGNRVVCPLEFAVARKGFPMAETS